MMMILSRLKPIAEFPLRLFLFWLLFFALFRTWFMCWHHALWSPDKPMSVWLSLGYALPLDASTAGYLTALPVIVWMLGVLIGEGVYPWIKSILQVYMIGMIAIAVLIFGANVFMYSEWNTVLSNRALSYLKTPRALFDSMSTGFILAAALLYISFVLLWQKIWRKWVYPSLYRVKTSRWTFLALPLWLALLALCMRGGLGVMAINESAVYYSDHLFDNHAATNPAWHLIHSQLEARDSKHSFKYMDEALAKQKVEQLFHASSGTEPAVFLQSAPDTPLNVVLLIMESMTAQVIEELDGVKGVCPNISQLIRESILFEHCYSSGFRTDQGLISVLAGYPAQPDQSIIFQMEKAAKLNSLPNMLREKGYSTLYCMGGELTFANIGVWMANQKLGKVLSESDFTEADKTQRWGADDKHLLQRFNTEVSALKAPFMATAITLSLHPPFDVPHKSQWAGSSDAEKFLHSANFADEAIGQFFEEAKKQSWYNNTIFMLVADHGAVHPGEVGQENPLARRIPLILAGAPLADAWRGKRITQYGNHHDIPATLLYLLGLPATDFPWSRNLLAMPAKDNPGFSYCANENGMLWIKPGVKAFFGFEDKRWQMLEGKLTEEEQEEAKAYLQVFYGDFMAK